MQLDTDRWSLTTFQSQSQMPFYSAKTAREGRLDEPLKSKATVAPISSLSIVAFPTLV